MTEVTTRRNMRGFARQRRNEAATESSRTLTPVLLRTFTCFTAPESKSINSSNQPLPVKRNRLAISGYSGRVIETKYGRKLPDGNGVGSGKGVAARSAAAKTVTSSDEKMRAIGLTRTRSATAGESARGGGMRGSSHGNLGRTPASGWLHRMVRCARRCRTRWSKSSPEQSPPDRCGGKTASERSRGTGMSATAPRLWKRREHKSGAARRGSEAALPCHDRAAEHNWLGAP